MPLKMCTGHLHDLREQLRRKNLWRLHQPERAQLFAQQWLAGACAPHEFDPLVVSILEINKKVSELCGQLVNGTTVCPICLASRHLMTDISVTWLDDVTDLMLLTAKVNHLA